MPVSKIPVENGEVTVEEPANFINLGV
jgi:hypothetical protein